MNKKLLRDIQKVADRNRAENIQKAAVTDTKQIYSAVVMALYELLDYPEDEKIDAITTVIGKSQEILIDVLDAGGDLVAECEKRTGINLKHRDEVERDGL